jgi:Protein of unknown function (DUF3108)
MARWLGRLSVALLLALAVHGVSLWTVAQEMQAMSSVIQRKADPMFTRQITQALTQSTPAPVVVPAAIPPKQAKLKINRAQAAIKKEADIPPEASLPEPSTTLALPDVTQSVALAPSPSLPEPSPTLVSETSTATNSLSSAATDSSTALASDTISLAATTPISSTPSLTTDTLVSQGNWPIDTRLTYDLGGYYRGDLHGDATVQWTRDSATQGEGYQVRIDLSVGPIKALLTSQGKVSAQGLLPQAYEEQWAGRQRSVTLDASDVVLTNGKRIPRPEKDGDTPALPSSVQDTASQFVELGNRFANGRAKLVEGAIVHLWLARPGGLDAWAYDVGPAETLYLPHIGPVQAYHLTPRPQATPRGSMVAEMWFAPSLQYLPVRIKLTLDKDAHLDLKVLKIEQR